MSTLPYTSTVLSPTEVFTRILDLRSQRDQHAIREVNKLIDQDLTGFGTATHEIFKSSEDILMQMEKEFMQTPNGFRYEFHWVNETKISDDTSVVSAEARFIIPLSDRTMIFNPLRISAVMHRRDSIYRLVHWHISFPDSSGSDEIFPGSQEPREYKDLTVIFTDFVDFTEMASRIPAHRLVADLQDIFVKFDELSASFKVDKIKTIGDAYMVVSGLCCSQYNHADRAIDWAQAALGYMEERNARSEVKWDIRIGMHSGHAIGGVIGTDKLTFDLWGDTVNIANRLEQASAPNRINISATTHALTTKAHNFEYRGSCDVKGKGDLEMYYVNT